MSTTTNPVDSLVQIGFTIAMAAAREYHRVQGNGPADDSTLVACVKSMLKIRWAEAMRDVKEALDAHMDDAADATFKASMALVGIEAAKESAEPPTGAKRYYRNTLGGSVREYPGGRALGQWGYWKSTTTEAGCIAAGYERIDRPADWQD